MAMAYFSDPNSAGSIHQQNQLKKGGAVTSGIGKSARPATPAPAAAAPTPSPLNNPPTLSGMDAMFAELMKQYGGSQNQFDVGGAQVHIGNIGNPNGGGAATPPRTQTVGAMPTAIGTGVNVNQGQVPIGMNTNRQELGAFGYMAPGGSPLPQSTGPQGLPPGLQALMGSGSGGMGGGGMFGAAPAARPMGLGSMPSSPAAGPAAMPASPRAAAPVGPAKPVRGANPLTRSLMK